MTAHLPETILVIDDEPMTPIDFSTIMIDLDGSVTGAEGKLTGVSSAVPTTSLSRNAFFDAPTQSDECLSFGLQTSPYEFVTTIVAPLAASPATTDPTSVDSTAWPQTPMVTIYRQWQTATDPATCGQVCDESDPSKYGCMRGTFIVGPNIGQAPYLTMAEPPGLNLSQQDGALYYIDTSTGSQQKVDCVRARTATMAPAPFVANTSYVVYNLFARNDSVVSYELFVGDGVNDLTAIKGRYVRVLPHVHPAGTPDFNSLVHDVCDPTTGSGWCATLPVPTVQNGILTLALDQRGIADDFKVSWRADYERCMPRDVCYFDGTQCQPCAQNPAQCIRQADFLPVDVQAMNQPDTTGQGPLDVVCHDWATFASGTTTTTPGELSLVDCPSKGCLGFAFTLPAGFNGNKTYQQVGATLCQCFAESAWSDNALLPRESSGRLADPLCGTPRPLMSSDFCTAP